ncbi:permease of the drug/metabolite transporter (dmt) superfamily [hydrocarbon metagenome]|uniref:Permease of the drug/metabolite transporter (Dmt) superfamily n=1 Tax=hydrocarbon metagenome TaxID=938273 RepID=A0A0W8E4E8_9ZZZZ
MSNKNNNLLAYICLLIAVILWGGNWAAVRYVVQAMPHLVVVTVRTVLAAAILLVVLRITGGQSLSRNNIKILALLGFVGIFGFNVLQYTGLKYTTAINGSLINGTIPILTILLSRIIIKERLSVVQLSGVIISFLGVGWVITNGSWTVIDSLKFNVGDIMMLLAAACWALYTIYGRRPTLEYSALYVTAYATLFAAIYFIPFGAVQHHANSFYSISWETAAAIFYVIVVAVIALVAWLKGVSIIGPSRASIFMNLVPVFTVLSASMLLDEMISVHQLIGAVFVLGGVFLTTNPGFAVKPKIEVDPEQL